MSFVFLEKNGELFQAGETLTTQHFLVSDLGLHCLSITILGSPE